MSYNKSRGDKCPRQGAWFRLPQFVGPIFANAIVACMSLMVGESLGWFVRFSPLVSVSCMSPLKCFQPFLNGVQAGFYRYVLGKLAKLHAEPYMRPGHPAFTESLLAVSCEVTKYP